MQYPAVSSRLNSMFVSQALSRHGIAQNSCFVLTLLVGLNENFRFTDVLGLLFGHFLCDAEFGAAAAGIGALLLYIARADEVLDHSVLKAVIGEHR